MKINNNYIIPYIYKSVTCIILLLSRKAFHYNRYCVISTLVCIYYYNLLLLQIFKITLPLKFFKLCLYFITSYHFFCWISFSKPSHIALCFLFKIHVCIMSLLCRFSGLAIWYCMIQWCVLPCEKMISSICSISWLLVGLVVSSNIGRERCLLVSGHLALK